MDKIDKDAVEGLLLLIGFLAVSLVLIMTIGWIVKTLIGLAIGILSVITFEAVLISLFAGVSAFVFGVSAYNSYQAARANKELADTFEDIDDYDLKLEAWKEHIREQEQEEERELQYNGGDQL